MFRQLSMLVSRFSLVAVLLFLPACGPFASSPDPGMIQTIVASTVEALPTAIDQPTDTATIEPTATESTPTETSSPTLGPTNTSQPTATLEMLPTRTPFPTSTRALGGGIILPTRTPTDPDYSCVVISQNPANYPVLKPKEDIRVIWTVRNVGKIEWDKHHIDIGYVSGEKMAIGGTLFDLAETIRVGDVGEIQLLFEAPEKPGTYVTNWSLLRGSRSFCGFSFGLVVKE